VVSIVKPARIAASAKSRLVRTKTDKADAALIAHFWSTQHPVPWTPPPAAVRELQARVRRVEMLQEMAHQEVNRRQSGLHSSAVRASMEATLAFLRQQIAAMQRLVQEQLEQSADLQHKHRLLCSLPGIGRWTAARVLAESDQVRRECASIGGVRWPYPTRPDLGDFGASSGALGEDRQQPFASRPLSASNRGDAAQSRRPRFC
jgi:transposase